MNEAITFWMDNKSCVGKIAVTIGDQSLAIYRDRYYVLKNGTAQLKGGKPLRYSLSSLPIPWKRALKGEAQLPDVPLAESAAEPVAVTPKRLRRKKEKPAMPEPITEAVALAPEKLPVKVLRTTKKDKPSAQEPVIANCPYCKARHELPVEKGKGGKPFFLVCTKCNGDFAVRFVQVTIYQAEVAGFRE